MTAPAWPVDRGSGYRTVQMVVAEFIGPDGPLPELPTPDSLFLQTYGKTYRGEAEIGGPDDVDLLACLALRTGASAVYTGGGLQTTVYHVDVVAWMVEADSGAPVGQPWVYGDRLNDQFDSYLGDTNSFGGVSWVATGSTPWMGTLDDSVVSFLGQVKPRAGVFQELDGWGSDEDLMLPSGTILVVPGQSSVIRLVVAPDEPGEIAFVEVYCAPGGTLDGDLLPLATGAPITAGQFTATTGDVELTGEFTSSSLARGTIRGLSAIAERCGVPDQGAWRAILFGELDVTFGSGEYELSLDPTWGDD